MTRLSKQDLEWRISLYEGLRAARDELERVKTLLPSAPPETPLVTWHGASDEAQRRLGFVVSRAWTALVNTALADAYKAVDEAEALVDLFEKEPK